MVRDPCVRRHGQVADDADDFVPAVRFGPLQPLAARRADVPESSAERVAAGRDRLGKVAVDDDRIAVCVNVSLRESATGEVRHLIEMEERGIDAVPPRKESRRPAIEKVDRVRHVAPLDVDEHPGLLAGWL
jgi:hypothetical protein